MENNNNNVWIDREEYERLKAIEAQQPVVSNVITTEPFSGSNESKVSSESEKSVTTWIAFIGFAALLSFIFPGFLIIFILLGLVTISRTSRKWKSKGARTGVAIAMGVVGTALMVIAAPFIFIAFFFVFWLAGCMLGTSCTSA